VLKRPGREVDYTPLSTVDVRNEWMSIFILAGVDSNEALSFFLVVGRMWSSYVKDPCSLDVIQVFNKTLH
jgi:hypothetical protein